jgi:hypothetical protein
VLAGAVVLALLAAGLMLYRQVTRLNYDLATPRPSCGLRGQQARAEHRIGDLADEVRDGPSWSVSACGLSF